MKRTLFILFVVLGLIDVDAQQGSKDSLMAVVLQQKGNKAEVDALVRLSLGEQQGELIVKNLENGLSLARKIGYRKGEADCHLIYHNVYLKQGDFSRAIHSHLNALLIYEEIKDYSGIASAHGMLQGSYREVGDYRKSLSHAFVALQTAEEHNIKGELLFPGQRWAALMLAEIGGTYVLMEKLDSALFYTQKSIAMKELFNGAEWGFPVYLLASILTLKGQYKPALETYRQALVLSIQNNHAHDTLQIFSGISTLFRNAGQPDSSIYYAQIVARGWGHHSEFKNLREAINNLAQAYKQKGNKDSALKYIELGYAIKDSLFSTEKDREVQWVSFNAKLKEEEIKAAQIRYKSKVQLYVSLGGLLALLCISSVLWHNNRNQQKAKAKVEQAYKELKATQAQLIQSEKMASLGELTAGIAHEIQNPLNFVNNFSEVSVELLTELEEEMSAGNTGNVLTIAANLKQNLEKITNHGKRADSIVKSMLQHSRQSSGQKELTDINALADEYLRLSYHGLRARDKNFNAILETHFDPAITQLEIMPQDIGRVLLNLFTNAFYSVQEKKKAKGAGFEPTVTVSTSRKGNHVMIQVKDNGMGIPQAVLDKIYQPFFTTKPAGEGTGLGLSMSYDIITKGHGGMLNARTKEGEYAEFDILLPARGETANFKNQTTSL
jgi:signal transduction histidine kinase